MKNYTLKKSLGQHFLHDDEICKKIISFLHPLQTTELFEIGPGAGALTKYLLEIPELNLNCIEIDKEKVDYLLWKYPALKGKIMHHDFLKIEKPLSPTFSVIGNFPYNISSQILFKLLEWRESTDVIIGMFQREVAKRITSKEGNKEYGILSVLLQCYYDMEYVLDVDAQSFTPPPKVQSGVIKLKYVGNKYHIENYQSFKQFVKIAFNQRRKTLRNGLKSIVKLEILQQPIFDKRAEQISPQNFVELYNKTL